MIEHKFIKIIIEPSKICMIIRKYLVTIVIFRKSMEFPNDRLTTGTILHFVPGFLTTAGQA